MALTGCNSLRVCFRHLGTSMEQKFHKSIIVFFLTLSLIIFNFRIFLLISNSIKLKYKVSFLVRKQRNKRYIFSVLFVINLN